LYVVREEKLYSDVPDNVKYKEVAIGENTNYICAGNRKYP